MPTLFAYAAPREGEVLAGLPAARIELGVGKTSAAIRLSEALAHARPELVFAFGLAGAYPRRHLSPGALELGLHEVCVVARSWLADEGVQTPAGFRDLAAMGLGEIGPFEADPELGERLASALGCARVGAATVSAVSGVEALSQAYAARTGASVETMESAAIASVCRRFGVRFAELRVISNFTGDRDRSGWDLDGSLARLHERVTHVLASGLVP